MDSVHRAEREIPVSNVDRRALTLPKGTQPPVLLQRRGRVTPWRCLAVVAGLLVSVTSFHSYQQPARPARSAGTQVSYPPISPSLRALITGFPSTQVGTLRPTQSPWQVFNVANTVVLRSGSVQTTPTSREGPNSKLSSAPVANRLNVIPTFLSVPAAKISVALERLLVNEKGTIDVPSNTESAGWWQKKRRSSPIVLAGHLDSKTGPAIFFHVQDLRFGDQIFLSFNDGSNASYTVRQVERVDKDKFPSQRVYNTGNREVRLVTCGGKFNKHTGHYEDNIVVYATPDLL